MKAVLGVFAVLALAGCGVTNNHDTVIKDAVANRVFLQPGGDATLAVVRDNGYFGGGCSAMVYVDNAFAADLEIGEQATFQLPAGSHDVTLKHGGTCRHKDDSNVTASLTSGGTTTVQLNARATSIALK